MVNHPNRGKPTLVTFPAPPAAEDDFDRQYTLKQAIENVIDEPEPPYTPEHVIPALISLLVETCAACEEPVHAFLDTLGELHDEWRRQAMGVIPDEIPE